MKGVTLNRSLCRSLRWKQKLASYAILCWLAAANQELNYVSRSLERQSNEPAHCNYLKIGVYGPMTRKQTARVIRPTNPVILDVLDSEPGYRLGAGNLGQGEPT